MTDGVVLILLYAPFVVMGIVVHFARPGLLIRDLVIAFLLVHFIGAVILFCMGLSAREAVWLIPGASVLGSYLNLIMVQSQPLFAIPFVLSLIAVVVCSRAVAPGGRRAAALCFAIAIWPFGYSIMIFSRLLVPST